MFRAVSRWSMRLPKHNLLTVFGGYVKQNKMKNIKKLFHNKSLQKLPSFLVQISLIVISLTLAHVSV